MLNKNLRWLGIYLLLIIFFVWVVELVFNFLPGVPPKRLFQKITDNPQLSKIDARALSVYYPMNPYNPDEELLRALWVSGKSKVGLVLGGSTAQGFPYNSNWDFGGILGNLLSKVLNEDVRIVNLGLSAQSSYTVADLSSRLLELRPDFVIVYSGHNEFYGTLSASSSPYDWQRRFYLLLQNSAFMRWLFKFLNVFNIETQSSRTLMEQQFDNQLFEPGPIDQEVASNFVQNLSILESWTSANKIPLIVIEPVSNLIDQPPFHSGKDAEFAEVWKNLHGVIQSDDRSKISAFVEEFLQKRDLVDLATSQYLLGKGIEKLTGQIVLEFFANAKDRDYVPFRARRPLIEALKTWASSVRRKRQDFRYVSLSQDLLYDFGPEAFGKLLFIDHLHFNFLGNYAVAKKVFSPLASVLKLSDEQRKMGEMLLNTPQGLNYLIPFEAGFAVSAMNRIKTLASRPPFSTMVIPVDWRGFTSFPPGGSLLPDEEQILRQADLDPMNNPELARLRIAFEYYGKNNQPQKAYEVLRSFCNAYPANYLSWLNLGLWHVKWGSEDKAKEYLSLAHTLAKNKGDQIILNQIQETWQKFEVAETPEQYFATLQRIPTVPVFFDLLLEYGELDAR